MDFTFLTREQVTDMDIFKTYVYGKRASITDFSVLLGGSVNEETILGGWTSLNLGYYWTKTSEFGQIFSVDTDGKLFDEPVLERNTGARPVVEYSKIADNISHSSLGTNGILKVEYGEYPQYAVSESLEKELEQMFGSNLLKKTGRKYTTDSRAWDEYSIDFTSLEHEEYEYCGEKYVRVVCNSNYEEVALSNGVLYFNDDIAWVRVSPITWLVDSENDLAISEKILFAGVQFNNHNHVSNFSNSSIKRFIDNYFSQEIVLNKNQKLPKEENQQKEKIKNPYGFNFESISEEEIIKYSVESGIPVFLHGRSSEGKSARVKQLDPDCTIIYLRNATPEGLNGKSVYNSQTGKMIDIKPTWLVNLEEKCEKEPEKLHILFFDEITNALPSIQGIAFNIVLDKEVNGKWKLPSNARIVAAGNEMKDSLAANQLAEPLFNRFAHVYIETTTDKWLEWASKNNIHPAIYAYIAFKRGKSLRTEYNGVTPNADPRKWEMASKILYSSGRPETLRALVGDDITREFIQFCKQGVITLDDVLNDNYTEEDLKMNLSEKYATVIVLTDVDEQNFIKVREFVIKLGPEVLNLFDWMWSKGDEARLEMIIQAKLMQNKKI